MVAEVGAGSEDWLGRDLEEREDTEGEAETGAVNLGRLGAMTRGGNQTIEGERG